MPDELARDTDREAMSRYLRLKIYRRRRERRFLEAVLFGDLETMSPRLQKAVKESRRIYAEHCLSIIPEEYVMQRGAP